jgi:hypothetical protein
MNEQADGPQVTTGAVQQFWWLHDARWYQGVLRRYGQQAANEINAEALRFVARRVAAWCARQSGKRPQDLSWPEVVALFRTAPDAMWDPEIVGTEYHLGADGEFETVVPRNFALKMLESAGTLEGYDCPCLEMRAGWFEGFGLSVNDSCVGCVRTSGDACRFKATVSGWGGTP